MHLNFVVSFGEIGTGICPINTDFINYLNHTYIFSESVFDGKKFHRTTFNLPIIAHLPPGSNLYPAEGDRGLSMGEWRSEYLSIHLKHGAPAFSPNNMRMCVRKPEGEGFPSKVKGKKTYKPKEEVSTQ
jgi:hypothetical protein